MTLEMYFKVTEFNFLNGAIRWQTSKSIHVYFAQTLTVFEILTFKMFNIENLVQGRGVQLSQ